jgi:hypothetical protein
LLTLRLKKEGGIKEGLRSGALEFSGGVDIGRSKWETVGGKEREGIELMQVFEV